MDEDGNSAPSASPVDKLTLSSLVESSAEQDASESSSDDSVYLHLLRPTVYKTYRWRWVVLLLFSLNIGTNKVLWITFATVADVMRCYYGISNVLVNVLGTASTVLSLLLVLPGAWLLGWLGLRFTIVLASATNALGAAIRVAGTGSSYYWLLVVGQTIPSLYGLMVTATPLLSEVWFPASERATATAIAVAVAPQLGALLGYLTPVIVFSDRTLDVCGNATFKPTPTEAEFNAWSSEISDRIFDTLLSEAVICIVILLLTILAFYDAPPTPPSASESKKQAASVKTESTREQLAKFFSNMLQLLKNPYFIFYLFAGGISAGGLGAVHVLLNELIQPYFPTHDKDIAYLGLMHLVSIIAIIITGRILDRTKAFYPLIVTVAILGSLTIAAFVATVQFQTYFFWLYITYALVSIFGPAFIVIALEYAVEMTYPLPEGISSGLLTISFLLFAAVSTLAIGKLVEDHDNAAAMYAGGWLIPAMATVGSFLIVFVRPKLKRVAVEKKSLTAVQD